jgi:hypothetical protein
MPSDAASTEGATSAEENNETVPLTSHWADDSAMIDSAVARVRAIAPTFNQLLVTDETSTAVLAGEIYPVVQRAKNDDRFFTILKERSNIRVRSDTGRPLAVIRALTKLASVRLRHSKRNDLARVIEACELRRVSPNPSAVREYLDTYEDVKGNGTSLKGIRKARAEVNRSSELVEQKASEKLEREKVANERFEAFLEKRKPSAWATVLLSDQAPSGLIGFAMQLTYFENGYATLLPERVTDLKRIRTALRGSS